MSKPTQEEIKQQIAYLKSMLVSRSERIQIERQGNPKCPICERFMMIRPGCTYKKAPPWRCTWCKKDFGAKKIARLQEEPANA